MEVRCLYFCVPLKQDKTWLFNASANDKGDLLTADYGFITALLNRIFACNTALNINISDNTDLKSAAKAYLSCHESVICIVFNPRHATFR